MQITMLFVLNAIAYKFGFSITPFQYIMLNISLLEVVVLHNYFKNLLNKTDIYINCAYVIQFISLYQNQNMYGMLIFCLISDYIADTIVLKKTFNYIGSDLIRGSPGSAGLDIKSTRDVEIQPSEIVTIETNVRVEIPENHFGFLTNRSSMAKKDLMILGGIIDSDYRGEIIVMIKNNGKESYKVQKDDKIAQIICIHHLNLVQKVNRISTTLRNIQNFGHSGR